MIDVPPKRVSSSVSARWAAPASDWSVSVENGRILARTASTDLSSASRASADMPSMRMSVSERSRAPITPAVAAGSPILPSARTTVGTDFGLVLSISTRRGTAFLLPISPSASTARSLTHQSLSLVASIRWARARSSLVWFRISIAVRRTSSSLSETSWSAAPMTCGPPILPSASAARLLTHQSASRIAFSRYFTEVSSPTTFSTSTAARRAPSDSSFSTSTRCRTVSGCLLRHRSSIAGFCTSSSESRSSGATRAGSTSPLPFVMARSAAERTSLFGSLSVR